MSTQNLRIRKALERGREVRLSREEQRQQRSATVSTTRRTKQGDSVARPPDTDPLHTGLDDLVVALGDAWDAVEEVAARQQRISDNRSERAARLRAGVNKEA